MYFLDLLILFIRVSIKSIYLLFTLYILCEVQRTLIPLYLESYLVYRRYKGHND